MAQFKEFRRGYQPWEHGQGGSGGGGDMGSSALDHDFVSTVGGGGEGAGDPWEKVAPLIAASGFGSAPADAAADATASWLAAAGAKSVLELGCGVGRGTKRLLSAGFAVRALDESAALTATARASVPGARIEEGSLTDPVGGTFDAVVSVMPAFSRLTLAGQAESFLESARASLQPGGLFSFVFFNRDALDEGDLCKVHLLGPFAAGEEKLLVYDQWRPHPDGRERFLWAPLFAPGDYAVNWQRRSIAYRYWRADELRALIEEAGFEDLTFVDAESPDAGDLARAKRVMARARAK